MLIENMRNTYKICIGIPKEMRPGVRPRQRWEDTIQIYLKETACKGMD
jgi:hypothetical protein